MMDSLEKAALDHLDRLYSFALRLTRNPADAEDLVQETFVRALPRLHTVREPAALRTWLFRVLYTTFVSRWQAAQRAPVRVDVEELDDLAQQSVPGMFVPDPRVEFFSKLLPDEMDTAVRSLPEQYRTPLLLQAIEGMTYDEISAVLQVPIGTVRLRLARARCTLSVSLAHMARQKGFLPKEELR